MQNILQSFTIFISSIFNNIISTIDEIILMSLTFHHRDIHIKLDEMKSELELHRLIFQAYKNLYEIVSENNAEYTKILENNIKHLESQLYTSQVLDSIRSKYMLFKLSQIELYQYSSDNDIQNDAIKTKFLEESLLKTKEFENEIIQVLNSAKE